MSSTLPTTLPTPIPKLPVFGWKALRGPRIVSHPSILDIANAHLTTSGQAAIAQALQMLGVTHADQVLIPTYHPPSILAPVVSCRAQMVFYPIDDQGNANLAWLEQLDTRNVKVMFAVHYFGLPRSMTKVRTFCDARGISLIEDCAHALFGSCEGHAVGSWGDISIASLTKFLPVLEGGVIASTRRPLLVAPPCHRGIATEIKAWLDLIETGSQEHQLGLLNPLFNGLFSLKRLLRGSTHFNTPSVPDLLTEDELPSDPLLNHPFNQALVMAPPTHANQWTLHASLREQIIEKRCSNFNYLLELLKDIPGARPLVNKLPDGAVPYVFPLLVEAHSNLRHHALRSRGIPLFRWGSLWPETPRLPTDAGVNWSRSLFQLPCHQNLDKQALQFIAETVQTVCHSIPAPHSS